MLAFPVLAWFARAAALLPCLSFGRKHCEDASGRLQNRFDFSKVIKEEKDAVFSRAVAARKNGGSSQATVLPFSLSVVRLPHLSFSQGTQAQNQKPKWQDPKATRDSPSSDAWKQGKGDGKRKAAPSWGAGNAWKQAKGDGKKWDKSNSWSSTQSNWWKKPHTPTR